MEALWPELFDPEFVNASVDFLVDAARGGSALEFGIGTGRVAVPLSERGVRVHGIELSPPMVAELRTRPGAADIGVTIGDFATANVGETFALVYLLRNTITNLTTQEEQVECFRNAAAHLKPGGCFVIENYVPERIIRHADRHRHLTHHEVSPSDATLRRTGGAQRAVICAPGPSSVLIGSPGAEQRSGRDAEPNESLSHSLRNASQFTGDLGRAELLADIPALQPVAIFKAWELSLALPWTQADSRADQSAPDHRVTDLVLTSQLSERSARAVARCEIVDVDLAFVRPDLDPGAGEEVAHMALRSAELIGKIA